MPDAHPSGTLMSMPLWVKLAHSAVLCVMVPVYWRHYGPGNFLWFSDLAMLLLALSLWREDRWPASVAAVAVLLPELAWNLDFFFHLVSGARLFGLSDYMFDSAAPLYLRGLSMFHVYLPALLVWTVARLGYERRALVATSLFCWVVLVATWLLTNPAQNVNWVFGPRGQQHWMAPGLYLLTLMLVLPACGYLPTHLLLKRLFSNDPTTASAGRHPRRDAAADD